MLKKVKTVTGLIVPDVPLIAREMTEKTQLKLVLDMAVKLSPVTLLKLIVRNVPLFPQLLIKDYACGVSLLCELTYLHSITFNNTVTELVLHSQMTDMAILLKNKKVFEQFFALCRWYKVKPALISNNPAYLVVQLSKSRCPNNLVLYFNDELATPVLKFCEGAPLEVRLVTHV